MTDHGEAATAVRRPVLRRSAEGASGPGPSHHDAVIAKKETRLRTGGVGLESRTERLRTIVGRDARGSAARKSTLHPLAKCVHARHPCIDGILYRCLLVGGKSAIKREPCRASLRPLRNVLLLQLIAE